MAPSTPGEYHRARGRGLRVAFRIFCGLLAAYALTKYVLTSMRMAAVRELKQAAPQASANPRSSYDPLAALTGGLYLITAFTIHDKMTAAGRTPPAWLTHADWAPAFMGRLTEIQLSGKIDYALLEQKLRKFSSIEAINIRIDPLSDAAPLFALLPTLPDLHTLTIEAPVVTEAEHAWLKDLAACKNLTTISVRADFRPHGSTPVPEPAELLTALAGLPNVETLVVDMRFALSPGTSKAIAARNPRLKVDIR